MKEHVAIIAEEYDRIDGKCAHQSDIKQLTLGTPTLDANQGTPLAVQLWQQTLDGNLQISTELPIHQVMDLMIFLSRAMLHFRDAYRFPLLYDPEKPLVDRIGLQGGAMPLRVCTENPDITADMQFASQALSDLGELTGERLRVLAHILEGLEV